MSPATRAVAERFWEKVFKGSGNECWEWLACKDAYGYGIISYNGVPTHAHRVCWILTQGPIPDGMFVCHHCDNRSCCNPRHLFVGTNADNQADKARKGRAYRGFGKDNPRTKLSDKQVIEIRHRYAAGGILQRELAAEFDVDSTTICNIITRRRRAHIKETT